MNSQRTFSPPFLNFGSWNAGGLYIEPNARISSRRATKMNFLRSLLKDQSVFGIEEAHVRKSTRKRFSTEIRRSGFDSYVMTTRNNRLGCAILVRCGFLSSYSVEHHVIVRHHAHALIIRDRFSGEVLAVWVHVYLPASGSSAATEEAGGGSAETRRRRVIGVIAQWLPSLVLPASAFVLLWGDFNMTLGGHERWQRGADAQHSPWEAQDISARALITTILSPYGLVEFVQHDPTCIGRHGRCATRPDKAFLRMAGAEALVLSTSASLLGSPPLSMNRQGQMRPCSDHLPVGYRISPPAQQRSHRVPD